MKKLLLMALMAIFGANAYAQYSKGDMSAGVNWSLSAKNSNKNSGIGAFFRYNITDAIRVEPSANYFFKQDLVARWDGNLNAHYLFNVGSQLTIYPLAGLSFSGSHLKEWVTIPTEYGEQEMEIRSDNNAFGINAGAGIEYAASDEFVIHLEVKRLFACKEAAFLSRNVVSVGCAYKF